MNDDLLSLHAEIQEGMQYEDNLLKDTSPVLWWADNYHQNSRGEEMDFTDTPFLVWLYQKMKTDERMVVEKSVQCFVPGTKITTDCGYKRIEDIQVGDKVLTHSGEYHEVLELYQRDYDGDVVTHQADVMSPICSTPEHPFRGNPYNKYRYHHSRYDEVFANGARWITAKDLSVGDFICRAKIPPSSGTLQFISLLELCDRPSSVSDGWFIEKWGQRESICVINLDYDFGLLVGLYLSEGWINATRVCFGFHSDERELEDIVRSSIERLYRGKDPVRTYVSDKDTCRRVFVSLYSLVKLFEIFGKGCSNKSLPSEWLKSAPASFLRGVFKGAMLGDGHFGRQVNYRTTSRILADQMLFIGSMFGRYSVIKKEFSHGRLPVYSLTFSSTNKYTRHVDTSDFYISSRIRKRHVTYFSGEVYNLRVAVDNSYVANDYVVHNCGISELFIISSHVEASIGLTVMYVLPKYELRNRFVNNRIYKLHTRVNHYKKLLKHDGVRGIHRTSMMHFGTGTLAYVGSNVESEFIEMPIDSAYVDEVDRCNLANLELLPDRYTASPYKFHRETSNPTIEGFGIDARYQKSSQGEWFITCEHCGRKFVPDFFTHVVREVGIKQYLPRDPNADPDPLSRQHMDIICECGKPVNRLMEGEYVHAYPNREWQGYRISKLFNKLTPIRGLYNKWIDAQGNDTKIQVFYNSDLGLPFSSKGAKITDGDLNACKRDYIDVKSDVEHGMIFCGVDVGAVLHFIVREMVTDRGIKCLRQVAIGTVPTFELLVTEVLDKWRPKMTVIDALPEIHKVQELKAAKKRVFSSMFQEGQRKIQVNKKDAEIKMDRTAILDYVKQFVDQQVLLLPVNGEFLENGAYYSHMKASTRILEANDEHPEKSRFVWAHTQADHFFLAEAYCVQAWMLVPHRDMFEFFKEQSSVISRTPELDKVTGLSEEEREKMERLSRMTPQQFVSKINKRYTK